MKTLIINGSPKGDNSNTLFLTKAFLEGTGWDNSEIITLSTLNIKSCLGCFKCWNTTPGKCVINDDMAVILEKIIEADNIIWSFPLYYFSVPGLLKNMMDRQLPLNLPFMSSEQESGSHPSRYNLTSQKHVLISTCGFWRAEGNYDGVIATFDHCLGKDNYEKIFCGQGELFGYKELRNRTTEYLNLVKQAGREYVQGGIKNSTLTALSTPLFPREVFEKMADASWGINEEGSKNNESLIFTEQMAALYRPDGKEHVIEIQYTDINESYQLVLKENNCTVITNDFLPYTTKIQTPFTVWKAIAKGEISGEEALFQQQYRVLGDFSLMLEWDKLFGSAAVVNKDIPATKKDKRTNMLVLLLPWIVLWSSSIIGQPLASTLTIIITALIPLLWYFFKPVIYEQLSIPLVISLSLAIINGGDVTTIQALGYCLFGLLWLISALTALPLTAHYSSNSYGGDKAYCNPLFMRTNRILTVVWGLMYVVMAGWTYLLRNHYLQSYILLINNFAPLLLGFFTLWFQKWYPAHLAKR